MLAMQAAGAEGAARLGPLPLPAFAAAALMLTAAGSAALAVRMAVRLRRGLPVVEPRAHPPAGWSGADVAMVALVYVALLAVAGTVLTPDASLRLQLLADVVTKTAGTLAGLGILRATGASWAALGWAGPRWRDDLLLAVGGLTFVLAPLLALAAVLDHLVSYTHPVVSLLQQQRDPVTVGLVVLAAVVVAPVAEEFFFRRVLQGWLEERLPGADAAAAIGLSAAAFAAAHVGHGLAPVPLFLLGVALGVIARATGSLTPCVLVHALFNAVGVGLLLAAPGAGS